MKQKREELTRKFADFGEFKVQNSRASSSNTCWKSMQMHQRLNNASERITVTSPEFVDS